MGSLELKIIYSYNSLKNNFQKAARPPAPRFLENC